MPPTKGRGRGHTTKDKGYGCSSWNDGGSWDGWSGYSDYYSYNGGKGNGWQVGGKGETRDQIVDSDRLMWEDSSSQCHVRSEKEELANLVVSKARSGLGIEDEDSSRSYDEGGVENDDGG